MLKNIFFELNTCSFIKKQKHELAKHPPSTEHKKYNDKGCHIRAVDLVQTCSRFLETAVDRLHTVDQSYIQPILILCGPDQWNCPFCQFSLTTHLVPKKLLFQQKSVQLFKLGLGKAAKVMNLWK